MKKYIYAFAISFAVTFVGYALRSLEEEKVSLYQSYIFAIISGIMLCIGLYAYRSKESENKTNT